MKDSKIKRFFQKSRKTPIVNEFEDDEENAFDDKPLETDNTSGSQDEQICVQPSLQLIQEQNKYELKNKTLDFSFDILRFLIIVIGVFVILDLIENKLGLKNPLLSEAFEILKYATTTVMGYLFASNKE